MLKPVKYMGRSGYVQLADPFEYHGKQWVVLARTSDDGIFITEARHVAPDRPATPELDRLAKDERYKTIDEFCRRYYGQPAIVGEANRIALDVCGYSASAIAAERAALAEYEKQKEAKP